VHKYRCTGLVKSQRRGPGRSRGVHFPPLLSLLCFVSCDVLQREGRPHGPFCFLSSLPDAAANTPPPSLNPFLPFFSVCWAWIFVSVLSDLPPSNSFRHEACFVLTHVTLFRLCLGFCVVCPYTSELVTLRFTLLDTIFTAATPRPLPAPTLTLPHRVSSGPSPPSPSTHGPIHMPRVCLSASA
jgi:hypothetical protein